LEESGKNFAEALKVNADAKLLANATSKKLL